VFLNIIEKTVSHPELEIVKAAGDLIDHCKPAA